MQSSKVMQLNFTLQDIRPAIWRRVLIEEEKTTLHTVHQIIQIVVGWENYHLHLFNIGEKQYSALVDYLDEMGEISTTIGLRLPDLGLSEGDRFTYHYDFGDGWVVEILIEKFVDQKEARGYPLCIEGQRAGPPEDVGGPLLYNDFLRAIRDPEHKNHQGYVEWLGNDFDPEHVDLDEINTGLHQLA